MVEEWNKRRRCWENTEDQKELEDFGKVVLKSCCECKHRKTEHVLTQDRLDVDVKHFCLVLDDDLDENYGKNRDCEYFEVLDELKVI